MVLPVGVLELLQQYEAAVAGLGRDWQVEVEAVVRGAPAQTRDRVHHGRVHVNGHGGHHHGRHRGLGELGDWGGGLLLGRGRLRNEETERPSGLQCARIQGRISAAHSQRQGEQERKEMCNSWWNILNLFEEGMYLLSAFEQDYSVVKKILHCTPW